MKKAWIALALLMALCLSACASVGEQTDQAERTPNQEENIMESMTRITPGQAAAEKSVYVDANGDTVVVPKDFAVSEKADEQTVHTGVVVIGPDGSEFVWVPTTQTALAVRDFGSYVSWGSNPADY